MVLQLMTVSKITITIMITIEIKHFYCKKVVSKKYFGRKNGMNQRRIQIYVKHVRWSIQLTGFSDLKKTLLSVIVIVAADFFAIFTLTEDIYENLFDIFQVIQHHKIHCTKMKFSIKDFFSKCDQICSFLNGKLQFFCSD